MPSCLLTMTFCLSSKATEEASESHQNFAWASPFSHMKMLILSLCFAHLLIFLKSFAFNERENRTLEYVMAYDIDIDMIYFLYKLALGNITA